MFTFIKTAYFTYHLLPLTCTTRRQQDYEQQLRDEFDQLYEEGATRRRMMLISFHDRISGHASRVRVIERFLKYVKEHKGVWFARKDEIAKYSLETQDITPIVKRHVAEKSGLAGNTNL